MGKTVLVIDDEAGYRALLSSDLSKIGYSVLTAASGDGAIKILEKTKVDCAITDMQMRPMDGLDTITAIRKTWATLPIILMTGYAIEERVSQALTMRVGGFLRKPFAIHEMRSTIKNLIETEV